MSYNLGFRTVLTRINLHIAPMKTESAANTSATPLRFRKTLSLPGMLQQVRNAFGKIIDTCKGSEYALIDVLMSGLAIFWLKYSALLKFDENRNEPKIRANLARLFGVEQAPCDTQLRKRLDEVSPEDMRPAFMRLHHQLQRQHVLDEYRYLGGILLSVDGTGQFSSTKISCSECCARRRGDDEQEYYHQLLGAAIVHPDKAQVFPVFPETITHQDGERKNDCERNAAKRLLPALRAAFPQRKFIVLEDSLQANGPHIKQLKELNFSYIIMAKPADHTALFREVNRRLMAGETHAFERQDRHGVIRGYRWVNDLALNASHPHLRVNFLDHWEIDKQGRLHQFTFITDIPLTEQNVILVAKAGRARWKVENETFNTLKNLGYHLEHNYGHGEKHLASVFANLMMLMFLIDQIQEGCCALFKAARQRFRSRTSLWGKIRGLFLEFYIENWEDLFRSIIFGHKARALQPDTS